MSDVYFADLKSSSQDNVFSKIRKIFLRAGYGEIVQSKDLVAIKTHFGEYGNLAYVPAPVIKVFADLVRERAAEPFVTDTNTLYRGNRSDGVHHLRNAFSNGFLMESAGAPVVIADGIRGNDFRTIPFKGKHYSELKVASAIHDADAVITVSHVKGHELYGFGGALKNICMGFVPPSGKQTIHSELKPRVKESVCTACGACIKKCPADATSFNERKKAWIDQSRCVGCGECVVICPYDAIPVNWKTDYKPLHERSAEYVKGILDTKQGKWIFFNFLMNISPQCDCYFWNDVPIVPNLGILASTDPVSLDRASADLINGAAPLPGSALDGKSGGRDNLSSLYPLDWKYFLDYCEILKIGETRYNLIAL